MAKRRTTPEHHRRRIEREDKAMPAPIRDVLSSQPKPNVPMKLPAELVKPTTPEAIRARIEWEARAEAQALARGYEDDAHSHSVYRKFFEAELPEVEADLALTKAKERLENAVNAVVSAAQELTQIHVRVKEGVVVDLEDWHELQKALGEWRSATQDFLTAVQARGARGAE